MDPKIEGFFLERKQAWLKKHISSSMDEIEVSGVEAECEKTFSLEEWLPNAANRAGQISIATHPCTFSHPSARKNKNGYVTSIISHSEMVSDGFLRSGNANVEADALGNAAALDVYKFLSLVMSDGRTLSDHIQLETEFAKSLLSIKSSSYFDLRSGFMAMVESGGGCVTSSKIKQVYFPIDEDYHLLSILSNSGMIYELRQRIDNQRFGESAKSLRELKYRNEYSPQGFCEIYGITTIGYGGTKPQNISVLNNNNGGKAHLLSSIPPEIEKRTIRFPKINFFSESFRAYECRDVFQALHNIYKIDYNNVRIREGRDYRLQEIVDRIVNRMWSIRSVSSDLYNDKFSNLKGHQLTWLLESRKEDREASDQWLEMLLKEISRWIALSYEQEVGKGAFKLGNEELKRIAKIVDSNREALR